MRGLIFAAAALMAAPGHAGQCDRGDIFGVVTRVRDGDTIVVGTQPIRLQGLAAPEIDEPGGVLAAAAMRRWVLGRPVMCELDGQRSHDRCVAVCYLHGRDLAEELVSAGLARDCPRFSGGRYRQAEDGASAAGARIGQRNELPGYCR